MVMESYSWGCLPMVVVYEILKYLSKSDRLQASSTCRHWRSSLWQPSFWRTINFRLLDSSKVATECPLGLAQRCGNFVYEAVFEFNSRSGHVVDEVRQILGLLGPNIQKIVLKPSSCQIDWPVDADCKVEDSVQLFVESLEGVVDKSRNLRHLSLGCISEITDHANGLLQRLRSKQLASRFEVLHIASIKEDPCSYAVAGISPDVLRSFSGLHTLSIDYDHLTEEVLHGFIRNDETNLRKLIIHVHNQPPTHAHISDSCWQRLATSGDVEVTLNLIHSTYGSANLLSLITPAMPLVHFRAFFCSHLNLQAVNVIAQTGSRLESFLVVDGMDSIDEPNVYEDAGTVIEDPFVMLAWKCPNLASFTLIGYEVNVINVIAIARLRGNRLKRVVIPECCLFSSDQEMTPEDFHNKGGDQSSPGRIRRPLGPQGLFRSKMSFQHPPPALASISGFPMNLPTSRSALGGTSTEVFTTDGIASPGNPLFYCSPSHHGEVQVGPQEENRCYLSAFGQMSESLGRRWAPLPDESLHPAVTSEGADAETFYLDILQSHRDEELD